MNRALILLIPVLTLGLAACGGGDSPTTPSPTVVTQDLVVGTGPVAAVGDTALVDYVGRLQDGTEFDNSYTRGEPLTFTIGAGALIRIRANPRKIPAITRGQAMSPPTIPRDMRAIRPAWGAGKSALPIP